MAYQVLRSNSWIILNPSFIGKKIIYFLIFFTFVSCSRQHSSNDSVVVSSFGYESKIITVGNHQYLLVHEGYGAGLCHYEDCMFCNSI